MPPAESHIVQLQDFEGDLEIITTPDIILSQSSSHGEVFNVASESVTFDLDGVQIEIHDDGLIDFSDFNSLPFRPAKIYKKYFPWSSIHSITYDVSEVAHPQKGE